jgi:hypothetical protein
LDEQHLVAERGPQFPLMPVIPLALLVTIAAAHAGMGRDATPFTWRSEDRAAATAGR